MPQYRKRRSEKAGLPPGTPNVYDLNFFIPEFHWPWGYLIVLLLMAVVGGGMVVYFKRKKWL